MTVDMYKMCPCGSGKKIKFCCRDLAHELERILRMVEADQRLAALDKIETLLKKHPDHCALLMLKAQINLELNEYAKVGPILEQVLALEPKNPSAHALRASMGVVLNGDIRFILESLQSALLHVDKVMPQNVYEAVTMTALYMIRRGLPFSAKGYLQLLVNASDGKDTRAVGTLNELNRSRDIPFLLREHISSYARPARVTWGKEFDMAMRVATRGVWGMAASMLQNMTYRVLDEPAVLQNLAVVSALNADYKTASRTFRQISELKRIPVPERVHALALANTFDPKQSGRSVDFLAVEFTIGDAEQALERLLSDTRLRRIRDAEAKVSPRPKAMFEFLDRRPPRDDEPLMAETMPLRIGSILLFGRQTDREPRVEFVLSKNSNFDSSIEQLKDVLRESLGERVAEKVVGTGTRLQAEFSGDIIFPPHAKPDEITKLSKERVRLAINQKWSDLPCRALDGLTPRAAARDDRYRVPILAELFELELHGDLTDLNLDYDAIRRDIGLPERDQIDLTERPISVIPVSQLGRVDLSKLSDEDLISAYRYSYAVNAGGILRKVAIEVVSRESLNEHIDKIGAYDVLAELAVTTDEALEWLEKSRKLATAGGESPASWLIDEFKIRVVRGELERCQALLSEITSRYIREPGVSEALVAALQSLGLVFRDGQIAVKGEESQLEPVAVGSTSSWTDEGFGEPVAPVASSAKPASSKLWLPNMD